MSSVFQSTHPHEVRPLTFPTLSSSFVFQSTHPHGVRHDGLYVYADDPGFNPRTRMGCDIRDSHSCVSTDVSIHAPAWGATIRSSVCRSRSPVSIHAPAWGATGYVHADVLPQGFQSTHPHGVRLLRVLRLITTTSFQSTHPHGVRPTWQVRSNA